MLRIAICQFGTETNTFASGEAELYDVSPRGWIRADEVISIYRGTRLAIGGALDEMAELGVQPVPMDMIKEDANKIFSHSFALSSMDHICEELKRRRSEYDAIFFVMHGGGCAVGIDDLESYTMRRVREAVPNILMMSSLDLHGNITPEMLELSDGLFGIKTVPHVDLYEAGRLAVNTLVRTYNGEVRPKMSLRRLPLLTTSSAGSTLQGVPKEIKEYFAAYVKEKGLLDATLFHGFSSADRALTCASVLVVADGYEPEEEAAELAKYVWERRRGFLAPSYSASEAIDLALGMRKNGFVVVNESSDNPGSGCPGDGTHLLRELLRRNLPRAIMGPILDPAAAKLCHTHKVGEKFAISFGGKLEPTSGGALELPDAELLALSDGCFVSESPVNCGMHFCYGPSARLRSGNVEFIIVTNCMQVYDFGPYSMTGAKLEDYDLIGLKSMNHFRAWYTTRADGVVAADTPGLRPANLKLLDYKNVIRPIFPLDEDVTYDGEWPK